MFSSILSWFGLPGVQTWLWVSGLAIVGVFIGWFVIRGYEIDQLQTKLKQSEVQVEVISQLRSLELKSQKEAQQRVSDIQKAPEKDNGPVSPILRRTLQQLQ